MEAGLGLDAFRRFGKPGSGLWGHVMVPGLNGKYLDQE